MVAEREKRGSRHLRSSDSRKVRARRLQQKRQKTQGMLYEGDPTKDSTPSPDITEEPLEEQQWKQKLHAILTQKMSPQAFERLVQRVLREAGFTQVEVTGRSGDGGIDGRGIARIPRVSMD